MTINTACVDIETLPCQEPSLLADLRAEIDADTNERLAAVKPDARLKDEAKIAADIERKRSAILDGAEAAFDAALRKTSLDASMGHVVAIGMAVNDYEISTHYDRPEPVLLNVLFISLAKWAEAPNRLKLVTFNGTSFDLPFLWRRAKILGVDVPGGFPAPMDLKPWGVSPGCWDHVDVMTLWAGTSGRIKQSKLARALSISTADNPIDGSMVYDRWLAGDYDAIQQHCREDVRELREIYRRLTQ